MIGPKSVLCKSCGADDWYTCDTNATYYCRPCRKIYSYEWYVRNKERTQADDRTKRYGVSTKQFIAMVEFQGGECAICHTVPNQRSLCIDHNHTTGEIRGLLCVGCNLLVGSLESEYTEDARKYLEVHHRY